MKSKNKILLVVLSCLLVVVFSLPAGAYWVNPNDNVLGYNYTPCTVTISNDYETYSDRLPTRWYDPRDFSSEVYYYEQYNEFTMQVNFNVLDVLSLDFDPMIYKVNGLYGYFAFQDINALRLDYYCYSLDGRPLEQGTYRFVGSTDNDYYFSVTDYLDSLALGPDDGNTVYAIRFELTDIDIDIDASMYLPLLPGDVLINDISYRPIALNDTIVNTSISSVPVSDFLWDSVSGFLSFEIAPNLQLYHILLAVVALPLLVWFLKVVAGG